MRLCFSSNTNRQNNNNKRGSDYKVVDLVQSSVSLTLLWRSSSAWRLLTTPATAKSPITDKMICYHVSGRKEERFFLFLKKAELDEKIKLEQLQSSVLPPSNKAKVKVPRQKLSNCGAKYLQTHSGNDVCEEGLLPQCPDKENPNPAPFKKNQKQTAPSLITLSWKRTFQTVCLQIYGDM